MRGKIREYVRGLFSQLHSHEGKVTIAAVGFGAGLAVFMLGVVLLDTHTPIASADDVSTSVTVLNTPPTWTIYAREVPESSTTSPTSIGSTVYWRATATDSNAEAYYLLICKTSGAATANSSAPPSCNGGIANQWAVSTSSVASGAVATVATTTIETGTFANELNDWYAFICDANASLPRCNLTSSQGSEGGFGEASSPFVVNHPPVFASVSNDGPADPGDTVTWTTVAYDTDTAGGADTVQLFVCKANDFNGTYCGSGGSWATSTLSASNPATTTTIVIPTRDDTYDAYVFVADNHGRVATSTIHGSNSSFVVSNVAPSLSAASIFLNNGSNIVLTVPQSTSGPFTVNFTVTDNNSCLTSASGNEIATATANIFRSGVASTSCNVSAHYNSNNCYVNESPLFSPFISCSQTGGTCSGATDTTAEWVCTYSHWYNADPTDSNTPYTAQSWLTTVQVADDDTAPSVRVESATGTELISFLAFNVSSTTIPYGGLEPGQFNDPLATTTDLIAIGNVGLDEDIYGSTMCTNWAALGGATYPDACDIGGVDATSEIPISNQKVATSSVAYASSFAYTVTASTTPLDVAIRVNKTTSTSSPQIKYNYWGINIPSAITLAGNYTGQNTITAKVSAFAFW